MWRLNFAGDNCCISGYECKFINEWYSECQLSTNDSNTSDKIVSDAVATSDVVAKSTSNETSSYPRGTGLQLIYQCKNPNHWAMTFDDGPTEYADLILDFLKKYNVKATFFVVGNLYMKSENPEWSRIIKRMDDEGHIIGNHTYNHKTLTGLTSEEIINEIEIT